MHFRPIGRLLRRALGLEQGAFRGEGEGKGDGHLLCKAPEGPFRQKVTVTFSRNHARLFGRPQSRGAGLQVGQAPALSHVLEQFRQANA